jgi:hypothetical protein
MKKSHSDGRILISPIKFFSPKRETQLGSQQLTALKPHPLNFILTKQNICRSVWLIMIQSTRVMWRLLNVWLIIEINILRISDEEPGTMWLHICDYLYMVTYFYLLILFLLITHYQQNPWLENKHECIINNHPWSMLHFF